MLKNILIEKYSHGINKDIILSTSARVQQPKAVRF